MPPLNCTEAELATTNDLVLTRVGQQQCLALVRRAIERHWQPALALSPLDEDPVAYAFVSLHIKGALRGCIGRLNHAAHLSSLLPELAHSCAFEDPRFPPLAENELPECDIEISLLGPRRPVGAESYDELLANLTRGDGLVLSCLGRQALFLPQVWQQLPEPRSFVSALFRKANWSETPWPDDLEAEVFGVQLLTEDALQ